MHGPAVHRRPRYDLAAAFVLRGIADLEYNDIAQRLAIPVSTVRFRTHEAREFVRRRLIDSAPR